MKNIQPVPALNRILALLVALISASFLVTGLAAAFLAAVGVPYFYGIFLIKLFPYGGSIFDVFTGGMLIMGITNIIMSYLTKGSSSARQQLVGLVRGFAYQLKHPFSDPVSPIAPSESVHNHEANKEILEIDPLLLKDYKVFFDSAYIYMGSYPLWKVQQEFRELILALEPNTDNPSYEYHFHNIDNYLSKIITVMASLKQIRPDGHPFWDDEQELSGARGDYLLELIKNKHPAFKEYSRD